MRRPRDTAADFLALESCQCRLTILGVGVGLGGCGRVSSGAFVTSMAGSTATASPTYAISHLSAFVSVSCERILPTVVCSGEAPKVGGGVEVPALIATIAHRPLKQRTASHTFLIMANPAWSEYAN